jgi:hypothetical protein
MPKDIAVVSFDLNSGSSLTTDASGNKRYLSLFMLRAN